jgi:hypothetical protein
MELFSTGNGAYLNWARIHNPDQPWKDAEFEKPLAEVPAPLYYALLSGLTQIVQLMLSKVTDVNGQGGRYGNALQAASFEGHDKIVELLLSKGADLC